MRCEMAHRERGVNSRVAEQVESNTLIRYVNVTRMPEARMAKSVYQSDVVGS